MHVYVSHSYITHTLYQCDRLQLSVLTSSSSRQSSLGYWTPYILLVTWACPAVRWLLDFGVLTLGWYIRNLGLNLVQIQHNQFSNTQYQRMIMWSYTWHLAWYMCMCDECMRSFTLDVPDDLPPHPKGFRRSKIQPGIVGNSAWDAANTLFILEGDISASNSTWRLWMFIVHY